MRSSAMSYCPAAPAPAILAHTAAAQRMNKGNKPKPPADSKWQESRQPGQRSGEGLKDLFDLLMRDIRRKAGLPPKTKDGKS